MGLKRTILLLLCMFVLISGCQYHPEASEASSISAVSNQVSNEVTSISDVSSQPSVPVGSSYSLEEYKAILQPHLNDDEFINFVRAYNVYPSPDGKNQYIEIETCIGYGDSDWINYVCYLFFNDFDHFVTDYSYSIVKRVKWIDNRRALIDRVTIIDIETGQKKNIKDNDFFKNIEWSSVVDSDVNAAGTQIATFNRRHFDGENGLGSMQYVYLYDIAEDQWQLLYETPYLYEDTSDPHAFIKWKTDDCLEFYLHYGAKFNYTISSAKIVEVPNFVVKDDDVFNAERLRKDMGFAGEQTIYMFDPDLIEWNLYTYMKEYNLKIAPGSYYIHSKDTYSDLMKKLIFVPNK